MHCNKLPVRSFKCVAELTVHEVSAPGARLAQKEDLYLNVCLLGQQRRTRLMQPSFPLKFADHLIFEKTFKFCRDPADVVEFLDDLYVLVELVQLGHPKDNEVLAWYETRAKEFLFPSSEFKTDSFGHQRDVLMNRNETFPGSISPRFHFSSSVRIDETHTPSLEILREYETRILHDPVIEINQRQIENKKKRAKSASRSPIKSGILRGNKKQERFAHHTISSAIKSDYVKPEVKFKLNQLSPTVLKTRQIKQVPKLNFDYDQFSPNFKPFVIRKVEDSLILRKPELHDVLSDGIIVTKKNPKGQGDVVVKPRKSGSPGSVSSRSRSRSGNRRSQSVGSSFHSDLDASDYHQATNESALFHTISSKNKERNPILSRALNDQRKRNSRSIGPKSGHTNKTIKRDLRTQNVRPSSAGNRNPNKSKDLDFNLLPESGDYANSSYNDFSCNHRYHDPLNQTQILDDNFHAAFTDNYSTSSFQRADEICRNLTTAKRNRYPRNRSFSYYSAPQRTIDWKYNRYYPWLFNYTEYLRELEDELYWLKVKSNTLDY